MGFVCNITVAIIVATAFSTQKELIYCKNFCEKKRRDKKRQQFEKKGTEKNLLAVF